MEPLKPVSRGARIVLGAAFFVVFFAVWAVATLGGFVSKTFLADPLTMVASGWDLLAFAQEAGLNDFKTASKALR